jgi:hypothetical protein
VYRGETDRLTLTCASVTLRPAKSWQGSPKPDDNTRADECMPTCFIYAARSSALPSDHAIRIMSLPTSLRATHLDNTE